MNLLNRSLSQFVCDGGRTFMEVEQKRIAENKENDARCCKNNHNSVTANECDSEINPVSNNNNNSDNNNNDNNNDKINNNNNNESNLGNDSSHDTDTNIHNDGYNQDAKAIDVEMGRYREYHEQN
eukprot:Awhi_evm1s3112